MVKYALSTAKKILLFSFLMMVVAKALSYDDLVNSFLIKYVTYDNASFISELILGEPDPEPYDSMIFYIDVLLNMLICVPLFSAIFSFCHAIKRKLKVAETLRDCGVSTLRRFVKLSFFTVLFCTLFRILPYQSILPVGEKYSVGMIVAVVMFNLILTIFCYWFVTEKITIKRSL